MDKQRAKLLLSGYRPNGKDAEDPEMRQALDLLEHDAELKEWFSRQQEFDSLISGKLHEFPVPEEVKVSVLAGRQLEAPTPAWSRRQFLAAAAVVLALLGITLVQWLQPDPTQVTLADFRQQAVNKVREDFSIDLYSQNPEEIDRWLVENDLPVAGRPIAERIREKQFGCTKMVWQGQPVSIVCLRKGKNNQVAHLFVSKLPELPEGAVPPTDEIILATVNDLDTASWQDGAKAYVLVGHAPSVRVAPFL